MKERKIIKKLLKDTDNDTFLYKVYDLQSQIKMLGYKIYSKKINNHFNIIKEKYLENNNNLSIVELKKKKIVFNYHLYLLTKYKESIYENLFMHKSIY